MKKLKRKKGLIALATVFLLVAAGAGYFFYDAYFVEDDWGLVETAQDFDDFSFESVSKIEIGKVYDIDQDFKLVDESHFVYYYAENYDQDYLDEAREEAETDDIYPTIWMGEGTYKKSGDDYYLLTTREVKLEFLTVAAYKKKTYSSLTESAITIQQYPAKPQLQKKDGAYIYRTAQQSLQADGSLAETGTVSTTDVTTSDEKLADSVESFLADYKKADSQASSSQAQ
ncbi:hypothetical protein [Streptococcus loxodontisalivarius]|uniref:Signal peptide containing protein n=1 Tax=Streptococcus loxodontisalivarius TaxID=1349415 RepID=A0ABS2PS64_9STRE|nr:hypothetical protein [Streptococcus loxodontisalivarius]MBM7642349.1 hypothetical protein [Streptococcus loxodontisalivarius]